MTTPLDRLWQALQALERQQRRPPPLGVVRDGDWFDEWQTRLNRVQHVRAALAMSGPTALRIIAERLPGIELGAIGQVLLSACKDVAAVAGGSALLGGAAGAALGSLAGGVGAIPGGLAGVGVGLQAATWVMGVLGLKELVQDLAEAVPQALRHYERGIRMAWGPVKAWEMPERPEQAHYELAEGHIVLLGAILAALAAYLTRGRGDPAARARLLQEIRQSPRLGPQVADWVAANEDKLIAHPGMRPRTQQVTMASTLAKDAGPPVTPAQLRRQREAGSDGDGKPPEAPPPRKPEQPRLPPQPVPCFHPYDKATFKRMSADQQREYLEEMAKQLRRQEEFINKMSAAEFKAARDAYAAQGRHPEAALRQETFGKEFKEDVKRSIQDSLEQSGVGFTEAKQRAAERTEALASKLNALHEPDMVVGGWAKPDAHRMGRADVNQSIGGSWNQKGRVTTMEAAADDAIRTGGADAQMNVKLEVCRGKGLR
ncbi:MAG: polymorphic toxin type 15 domain-containing protein [Rhodococcus sp. (in: high G+C Gram-positive bacteria)]|uniref:DUF6861 domain-containing protein n=1 Tax=Rhodococcus sp. TaxID=1831 RepID=UPI002ADD1F8F|nr:polymorphic toxin type 15 domain-containing protein [Rhodococcus sp. (in: high G+C Gram-positive bacteria)]